MIEWRSKKDSAGRIPRLNRLHERGALIRLIPQHIAKSMMAVLFYCRRRLSLCETKTAVRRTPEIPGPFRDLKECGTVQKYELRSQA